MKHFGIFDTVEDAQDALNAGRLENDYVALVDGYLDYNSMSPEEPCYLGEWSDDGAGHYTFQIFDTGDVAWLDDINIGQLKGVYFMGDGPMDMDVTIHLDVVTWTVTFVQPNESEELENPWFGFEDGISDGWDCIDVMTDGDSSTASVHVDYDGVDTFEFYQMAQDAPALSLDTINPECPPSE